MDVKKLAVIMLREFHRTLNDYGIAGLTESEYMDMKQVGEMLDRELGLNVFAEYFASIERREEWYLKATRQLGCQSGI